MQAHFCPVKNVVAGPPYISMNWRCSIIDQIHEKIFMSLYMNPSRLALLWKWKISSVCNHILFFLFSEWRITSATLLAFPVLPFSCDEMSACMRNIVFLLYRLTATLCILHKNLKKIWPRQVDNDRDDEDAGRGDRGHVHPAKLDAISDGGVHLDRADDEVSRQGDAHRGEDRDAQAGLGKADFVKNTRYYSPVIKSEKFTVFFTTTEVSDLERKLLKKWKYAKFGHLGNFRHDYKLFCAMHLTTYFEDIKIKHTVSKLQPIEIYYSDWSKPEKSWPFLKYLWYHTLQSCKLVTFAANLLFSIYYLITFLVELTNFTQQKEGFPFDPDRHFRAHEPTVHEPTVTLLTTWANCNFVVLVHERK